VSLEHFKTQVLLLHSQQSTLDTLSAGFTDKYSVHCATSGTEALNTLGDTPIHVLVSAQDLPGMSGLEALREAKKRSPDTIGILLAGTDKEDGLEALVSDQEVFQIVRGTITPDALIQLIESATKRVRLMALAESANDQRANVDEPVTEHIVMETSANGSTIISDGTGTMPALRPEKIEISPGAGGREVDVLVLTKDEEFLGTIKDSARGLHNVHHAVTQTQAENLTAKKKIGVLVTDAAMAGDNIETLTKSLRKKCPRLVAIVAGRRDDGELLMDLINRGHVYRFLLKPVSPGRSRLAIEASVKHHMEAPEEAFKPKSGPSFLSKRNAKAEARAKAEAEAKRKAEEKAQAEAEAKRKAEEQAKAEAEARRKAEEQAKAEAEAKRKAEEQAKAEAEAKRKAEEQAKAEAEAKREAEQKAREEAEAKARAEAEARAKAEAEEKARVEAEEKAKAEARAKAVAEAEERARAKAEAKARAEAEAAEKARAKAEAKAKAKAEAAEKARVKAEAKAKAKAEAAEKARAKAEAKAEAKAKAKAEAEAKAKAKAEAAAMAQAKADAAARESAENKIEPVISDYSMDSRIDSDLEDTFGETNSFTDTMTDIAAAIGETVSGAAGSVAEGAHDLFGSIGETDSPIKDPKVLAIGGGAVVAIALVGWFVFSGDPAQELPVLEQTPAFAEAEKVDSLPTSSQPAAQAPAAILPPGTESVSSAVLSAAGSLERARSARDAGNIIAPAGNNAVELYLAAVAEAGGDPVIEAELSAVVDQALGIAEAAILADNADEAGAALDIVRFADSTNPRLNFLGVQVNELLLRDRSEKARLAIREGRFEDAGRLISEARSVAGTNTVDVDLLTDELDSAKSQQQVGETITKANARLESGNLVTPANDNARYYFELALSNDPQSQAAQQGLIAIASKLVIQARDAIDNGQLNRAEDILDDASELDPSSSELSAAVAMLASQREAVAEVTRKAEAERQAALQRQQEQARQSELKRLADQERQANAAEEARIQSEVEANKVATASPLGVGAQAPSRPAPKPAPAQETPRTDSTVASSAASPPPQSPARQTSTQDGATTFRMAESSGTRSNTVTQTIPAPPPARVQTQAASTVNLQSNRAGANGTVGGSQEPEMVPVSQLTRINYVGPEYPRAARRRNVQGSVDVGFVVTTDGRVRSLTVLNSDPGDTFDQAALDAVEQWRFEPVMENGAAVEKRTAVRLAFNLQ
jgi:TonB family protein